MTQAITKIVVVGGGTAGWLAAALIASYHQQPDGPALSITLIESADIPTIGVGEGTWPTMKNTLQQIGLSEKDFFRSCHAAFKQGGKFVNWCEGTGDFYYHPFTVPLGYGRLDVAPYLADIRDYARQSNMQHELCEAGKAPRPVSEGEYQGPLNYAYHLDAGAFADVLKQHAKTKLGVLHRVATVEQVLLTDDAQIAGLKLNDAATPVTADLYIDCTGMASLLLGKTLQVPFLSVEHQLFNNRALALQVPYDRPDAPVASHTIATAQNAGWIWDIGLSHRRGTGHVYASQFLSDDEAATNLRRYVGAAAADLEPRLIKYQTGYRERFWQGNCVAIGLSAGFVEPLEATAIMLVEVSARYVAENLPADQSLMPVVAKRFNTQMRYRWQRIIDFLKLHYMLTKRPEPYWQAHLDQDTWPESLQEDLAVWRYRGPAVSDFQGPLELFPAASYQYVMYGMGFKPDFSRQAHLYRQQAQAEQILRRNQQLTQQLQQSLPSNREYLQRWLAQESMVQGRMPQGSMS